MENLQVRSLAVLDKNGVERMRLAAPLPDRTEGARSPDAEVPQAEFSSMMPKRTIAAAW